MNYLYIRLSNFYKYLPKLITMKKHNSIEELDSLNTKKVSSIYPPPTGLRVSSYHIRFFSKITSFLFLLVLMSITITSFSQSPPPISPISNLPQWRGMYVSCGDELIQEIYQNGNQYDTTGHTLKTQELFDYATQNYFKYLAIYSLTKRFKIGNVYHTIIGDSIYWDALREFLKVAHQKGIEIGMVVTNKDFLDPVTSTPNYSFNNSPFYYNFSNTLGPCGYDTSEVFAFAESNINTPYINPDLASEVDPDSETFNVDEFLHQYPLLERAEMLKGILRLMQYTYATKQWLYNSNDCADCSDDEYADAAYPPLGIYAFDYISVEYEYWNSGTFNNFNDKTTWPEKTKEKFAWDNFIALTQMAFYAERMMCGQIKTELELVLEGPRYESSYSSPITQWDTAAGNVPWVSAQAAFIGKYYNRILLTDYRPTYNRNSPLSLIRKVGAAMTKFHNNPSSLSAKTEIIPLFSAASQGEKKHCFGSELLDVNGDTMYWGNNFFGPYLNSTISPAYASPNPHRTDSLVFFEWEFNYQCELATNNLFYCDFCNEYDVDTNTTCIFETENNYIGAFMWYNYSTLNNPTSVAIVPAHQYHRIGNSTKNEPIYLENKINFNVTDNNIEILINSNENNNTNFALYDSKGRVLMEKKLKSIHEIINVDLFPEGLYLAKVFGTSVTFKKIIKIQ